MLDSFLFQNIIQITLSKYSTVRVEKYPFGLSKKDNEIDVLKWCPRWDSNPQSRGNAILSRARIPVPPLGQKLSHLEKIFNFSQIPVLRSASSFLCCSASKRFCSQLLTWAQRLMDLTSLKWFFNFKVVPGVGLEPTQLSLLAPKASVSAISPPGHRALRYLENLLIFQAPQSSVTYPACSLLHCGSLLLAGCHPGKRASLF